MQAEQSLASLHSWNFSPREIAREADIGHEGPNTTGEKMLFQLALQNFTNSVWKTACSSEPNLNGDVESRLRVSGEIWRVGMGMVYTPMDFAEFRQGFPCWTRRLGAALVPVGSQLGATSPCQARAVGNCWFLPSTKLCTKQNAGVSAVVCRRCRRTCAAAFSLITPRCSSETSLSSSSWQGL